jgi:diphosphomevalonate decarboxylase
LINVKGGKMPFNREVVDKGIGKIITSVATSNIALIKYWGKRDDNLILPYNSSFSITLDETYKTETSIAMLDTPGDDIFYLNGVKQDISNKDIKEQLDVLKYLKELKKSKENFKNTHLIIYSKNYFPTAAGLASSASGISALVYAINAAYELNLNSKELSILARRGSGSSCRSLFGGFVRWNKGNLEDGSDSYAEQVFPYNYMDNLIIISAIVSLSKKKISSRGGMAQTVKSSELYKLRSQIAEEHVVDIIKAIENKDLNKIYEITMKESNQLHALCLDTYPPIIYLNDVSYEVISKINELNQQNNRNVAAYTFDAGPNPYIITTKEYESEVIDLLKSIEQIEKDKINILKVGKGPRILSDNEKSETREELRGILKLQNIKID